MSAFARSRWTPWLLSAVVIAGVLGLYRSSGAQSAAPELPFANAVEQRIEMINQLKELNAQLKEQNALLRSGKLQVVVARDGAKP